MIKRFFLVLFFLTISSVNLSYAQVHLDKAKVRIDVSPGETVSDKIIVTNTSDKEVKLNAYWEDFIYLPPYDGNKKFSPIGTLENSLDGWVSYSPQQFIIPPKQSKEISYVIRAPENAKGGRYGVLFFEKHDPSALTATGVKIITRVGCLFFVELTDNSRLTNFNNISIKTHSLRGEFINQGNVISIPNGVHYIMDSEGLVVDRGEVGKVYVPPGAKVAIEMKFTPELKPGRYSAVITFDFETNTVLVKEVDFEKTDLGMYNIIKVHD